MADHLLHLDLKPWMSRDGYVAENVEAYWSFTCEHGATDARWWHCEANPCWLKLEWDLVGVEMLGSNEAWPADPQFPIAVRPVNADDRYIPDAEFYVVPDTADQRPPSVDESNRQDGAT